MAALHLDVFGGGAEGRSVGSIFCIACLASQRNHSVFDADQCAPLHNAILWSWARLFRGAVFYAGPPQREYKVWRSFVPRARASEPAARDTDD
jgi:hypothetical protein